MLKYLVCKFGKNTVVHVGARAVYVELEHLPSPPANAKIALLPVLRSGGLFI